MFRRCWQTDDGAVLPFSEASRLLSRNPSATVNSSLYITPRLNCALEWLWLLPSRYERNHVAFSGLPGMAPFRRPESTRECGCSCQRGVTASNRLFGTEYAAPSSRTIARGVTVAKVVASASNGRGRAAKHQWRRKASVALPTSSGHRRNPPSTGRLLRRPAQPRAAPFGVSWADAGRNVLRHR